MAATGALTPITRWVILDDGVPVAGAKLYTYLSGTSTASPVYTTPVLNVEHTNPVVADADGVLPVIYLGDRAYRFLVTDSAGATIFAAQDNVFDFAQMGVFQDVTIEGTLAVDGATTLTGTTKLGSSITIADVAGTMAVRDGAASAAAPMSASIGTFSDAVILGAATTSGIRLEVESGICSVREGDDSAAATMRGMSFQTMTALITAVDGGSTGAFTANMVGSTGGPTTAAQNGWIKMLDSTGATVWIPVWK